MLLARPSCVWGPGCVQGSLEQAPLHAGGWVLPSLASPPPAPLLPAPSCATQAPGGGVPDLASLMCADSELRLHLPVHGWKPACKSEQRAPTPPGSCRAVGSLPPAPHLGCHEKEGDSKRCLSGSSLETLSHPLTA